MFPKFLVVLLPERKDRLLQLLDNGRFQIECISDVVRAREVLRGTVCFDLVFLDAELCNGVWQGLLETGRRHGTLLSAVVCSGAADHRLWADVLQTGAYDLLVEPLDHNDVVRVIDGALNSRRLAPPLRF